ncbi:MAG: hypothetical protein R3D68_13995 [Hyphomicrobiaceae bacterium]
MAKDTSDPLKGTIKGDAARKDRLAAQLRENLKRRKTKARAQAADAADKDQPATPTNESDF